MADAAAAWPGSHDAADRDLFWAGWRKDRTQSGYESLSADAALQHGQAGQIVENMFIRLQHGETRQNLNIWAYGEQSLARGSGLFIPEIGVATNHHFLPPPDREHFAFLRGLYSLEVFIKEVGSAPPYRIFTASLDLSAEMAAGLAQSAAHGVYFDWGPDSGRYHPHLRPPPTRELPGFLRDTLSPTLAEPNG